MKYHKLYADESGESHWEVVEADLIENVFAPPARGIEISEPEPAVRTMFLRLHVGWNEPIHPTRVRQRLVCVRGSVRVTASDGEFRDIGPGDIWHMEDKSGKGHHTFVTSDKDFRAVVIQFE